MAQAPRNPNESGDLPRVPIRHVVEPVVRFMHIEAASGVVLIGCIVGALALAKRKV